MSSTLSLALMQGFYEKTVLKLLSEMQLGTLHLTLPSGNTLKLGNGGGSVEAFMTVHTPAFFKRCVLFGDIGFGESYVDGEWDTENITELIKWFVLNIENAPTVSGSNNKNIVLNILRWVNKIYHANKQNSLSGSSKNISAHYDLNNDFFALFLDDTMTYSSAYFKNTSMTLREAQMAKYNRLCKQLRLNETDHVLEIGSGWGANAIFIARNYGCKVTTLTISEQQFNYAKEKIKNENLEDQITVILKDYRAIEGQFDKIVSIEMLEAVGAEFYDTYFKKCNSLLKKNGIFALQVITCPDSRFENIKNGVDWIQKHIFPGSLIPSVAAINNSINASCNLTLVDLKDIGLDYANTLRIWHQEFNKNIDKVKQLGFDDYFIRKWNYYLCYCEAAFAMRNINVMQLIYTRPNNIIR